MILFKKGVDYYQLNPILWAYTQVVHQELQKHDLDLCITSIRDGSHMAGSRHYLGMGIDFRSKMYTPKDQLLVLRILRRVAKSEYPNGVFSMIQVKDERKKKVHYHVEMDSKRSQVD